MRGGNSIGYIPLVVHSAFSEGAMGIEEWVKTAKKRGIDSIALADRRKAYGWGLLERCTSQNNLRPAFGMTFELPGGDLVLFLKEREGYSILTRFYKEGLNDDSLYGLVGIFIPQGREIPQALLEAFEPGDLYLGASLENFHLIREVSQSYSLKTVWANPTVHLNQPQRFLLIKSIREKKPYPRVMNRYRRRAPLFGLLPSTYILKVVGGEAIDWLKNTYEVAEKLLPTIRGLIPPLPQNLFKKSLRDVVYQRLREGAFRVDERFKERLEYEISVIEKSGFGPYFLLVADLIDFARKSGIFHNLKGSGASSLVAYVLGISRVNPLKYGLYFERFLNPGRDDPPDIDIDFDSTRRDEVIDYLFENYKNRVGVSMLAVFKRYGARSALYDVARAFGYSPKEAKAISSVASTRWEPADLKGIRPPQNGQLVWQMAMTLQGIFREASLHLGGVLLTPPPDHSYLFFDPSPKGYPFTHFDRDDAEYFGFIKLDLLSVRGLFALSESLKISQVTDIPEDDRDTWDTISQGKTMGCFQIESPGMMALLKRLKPRNIDELAMALALIRPGPTKSGMKDKILRIRKGQVRPDPLLFKLLPETMGILLYEEQVMQLSERMAGFGAEEGEHLRRALKNKGDLEFWRDKFFRGALEKGFSLKDTEKIWKLLLYFSSYSFNKAHSISYAWAAYRSAYMKRHHPVEYMKGVLDAEGGYYTLDAYIEEARRMGIRILPPDVRKSKARFTIEGNSIRVGLGRIANLSTNTLRRILEERKKSNFKNLEDFQMRVKPSSREALSLSRSGALDSLELDRNLQRIKLLGGREETSSPTPLNGKDKEREAWKVLGFTVNQHPLGFFNRRPPLRVAELMSVKGERVKLALYLLDFQVKEVPRGKKAFFLFDDETGVIQGIGSPGLKVPKSRFLLVEGRVRAQDGGQGIIHIERLKALPKDKG